MQRAIDAVTEVARKCVKVGPGSPVWSALDSRHLAGLSSCKVTRPSKMPNGIPNLAVVFSSFVPIGFG